MALFKVKMEIVTNYQSMEEVSFDVIADSEEEARAIASDDYSQHHTAYNSWPVKQDTEIESLEVECIDATHDAIIRCRQTPDMFAGLAYPA